MLFTSYIFYLLLGLLLLLLRYTSLPRLALINLASLLFYGAWNPAYCLLLLLVILASYYLGLLLENGKPGRRGRILALALVLVFLPLLFYKYQEFLLGVIRDLASLWGPRPGFSALDLILPVGISFYSFQAASYLVDVYRGSLPACRRLSHYFMYISFFPQLIAGPIERAGDILPQVAGLPRDLPRDLLPACDLFLRGLVKKAVFADSFATYSDRVFGQLQQASFPNLLAATAFFTLQIYCDFAGYTDMARGLGRALGIRLSTNFDYPYLARNIADFWRRWHITLSHWFRDYIYIPLGGSRRGRGRTYLNLVITMALCGLWHGAAYTFVIWGLYHGLLLALHRFYRQHLARRLPLPRLLCWALTLALVSLGWFIFRARELSDLALFFHKALHWRQGLRLGAPGELYLLALIFVGWQGLEALVWRRRVSLVELAGWRRLAFALAVAGFIYVFKPASDVVFIYFQF